MTVLQRAALISLLLTEMGCAVFVPKETLYLKAAQDRATQEGGAAATGTTAPGGIYPGRGIGLSV